MSGFELFEEVPFPVGWGLPPLCGVTTTHLWGFGGLEYGGGVEGGGLWISFHNTWGPECRGRVPSWIEFLVFKECNALPSFGDFILWNSCSHFFFSRQAIPGWVSWSERKNFKWNFSPCFRLGKSLEMWVYGNWPHLLHSMLPVCRPLFRYNPWPQALHLHFS